MSYQQQLYTSPDQLTRRHYGNTVAEVSWSQQLGRFSSFLRPYYWVQSQTLPTGTLQRADSYRLQATLRYESPGGLRTEAGLDLGRYDSKAPADRFQIPSYRYVGSFGMGRLNVLGIY